MDAKKKCHIIVRREDGTFGVAETTLNSNEYDPDKVEGSYRSTMEAVLGHGFGENGWKIHPNATTR